jgi:uncharacterized phage protein gp47/JayE
MPVFTARNRVDILREMAARVVARSGLIGLTRNGVVFHVLAAAADEDADAYYQMARLRDVFSVDKATGSDLDARAAEVLPGTIRRRAALFASGNVIFSRPGIVGAITIPSGTVVAARDSQGQIKYRTTAVSTIAAGATTSAVVPVVALEAGLRANVDATQINQMVSRVAGVTGVSNSSKFFNGQDRESDPQFRARVKNFVQSLSRGTPTAIMGWARNVILTTGQRVLFARLSEPVIPNGQVSLFIDDGTGTAESFDSTYVLGTDLLLTAVGGEKEAFTTKKPIRDDGSFVLYRNLVALVRGADYYLNPANGQVVFDSTVFPIGLTVGDSITAHYRYYTGLIYEVQRVVDGDPLVPLTYPGVRPAGIVVFVVAATALSQTIDAQISVSSGYDVTTVSTAVKSAIQDYINGLDISGDVIVAKIVERAMSVDGMINFTLTDLSGSSPPADQIVLENQVARITSASITLT